MDWVQHMSEKTWVDTTDFGVALVEALASGMPTVITNKINIWKEIDKANAGLVTRNHKISRDINPSAFARI